MAARTCLYKGSGAVMISELVDGSAWMKPPVEGPCEACKGAVAAELPRPPPLELLLLALLVRPPAFVRPPRPLPPVLLLEEVLPPLLPPPPPLLGEKAARSTVASFTASAFFR